MASAPSSASASKVSSTAKPAQHQPLEYVTTQKQLDAIVAKHLHVLVDFSAMWCGPCKQLKPKLEALAAEDRYSYVKIIGIDIERFDNAELIQEIESLPTFFFYAGGRKDSETLSSSDMKAIREYIDGQSLV